MSNKNEYLHSIATRLLLGCRMKHEDTVKTVKEYSEIMDDAVEDGLSIQQIQEKLGSSKEVETALREENIIRKPKHISILLAIFSMIMYIVVVYTIRKTANTTITEIIISMIVTCCLIWFVLCGSSLAGLIALKQSKIQKKKFIMLNMMITIPVVILQGYFYYALYNINNWSQDRMWTVGPTLVYGMHIIIFINIVIILYSIYLSIKHSPYYIAVLTHMCGSFGFLWIFYNMISDMNDPDTIMVIFWYCIGVYIVGIILSAITILLVSIFHIKGSETWTNVDKSMKTEVSIIAKNEYLHSIGVRLILTNTMKSKDMIETVKDYREIIDEAAGEGLSFEEIQAKIGTPKQVIAAIRNENKITRKPILISIAITSIILYILMALIGYRFQRYYINFTDTTIIITAMTIVLCGITWFGIGGNPLSRLIVLREKSIQKKKFIVLNVILMVSVVVFHFFIYSIMMYNPKYKDYLGWIEADDIGPMVAGMVTIIILINTVAMLYSLHISVKQSPYYLAIFSHVSGVVGFLWLIRTAISNMSDPDKIFITLVSCFIPYTVGVILSISILILVRILDKKGAETWIHR